MVQPVLLRNCISTCCLPSGGGGGGASAALSLLRSVLEGLGSAKTQTPLDDVEIGNIYVHAFFLAVSRSGGPHVEPQAQGLLLKLMRQGTARCRLQHTYAGVKA